MLSRRAFGQRGFAAFAAAAFTEAAFAQRGAVMGTAPAGTAFLNANEFPEGPPQAAIEAMTRVLAESNRYHYKEFPDFYQAVAASEKFSPDHLLMGAGSSENIHCAIEAFASRERPLITSSPTYEAAPDLAAVKGFPVVKVPLTSTYAADVRKLAAEAQKAGGGLIYLCNPNNPTASITPKGDVDWLVANLPANTYLLVDEAYIHFSTSPELESALKHVRAGKNVIVTRTFSKIYGMAGLRAGFSIARPDLTQQMTPYRNNVISIVTARAVLAALDLGQPLIQERRNRIAAVRAAMVKWCHEKNLNAIDSHANFMMVDVKRDVRELAPVMLSKGVAVGRHFPPYDNVLRITLGTEPEMAKFRTALGTVLGV
jgi:histidinol-phosphate aminotransferase